MKGYLQVYTGDGKGKTTAAIGLAVRAAGAGLRVLFAQFVKGSRYSEIEALARYADHITICQYGRGCFIEHTPTPEDVEVAKKGLVDLRDKLRSGAYQVVILDEANIAMHFGLFTVNELLTVIRERCEDCEVVVTGRNAPPELVEAADLVTEMKEIKHYYTNGVAARDGIER
ncbi:MAG: cob(I)yrinic acid a,c-diamide adenosyltransferase [Chitinivibrionales bacterium]|nr:cob(I)yrinic acid a,c-diamide adenosyltransferase [Chitinivibrionales bacterium]MBD3356042.1 cob(I)yrinic acid a,c-diamide adenosyltransferase [Chitinivibrionales bacterium]